jgi:hypothetical protein
VSNEMISAGCGVTILGRSGLRYREGSKTLLVDGEMLTGSFDFVIYANSIKTWEGTGEAISDAERQRIVASIRSVLQQNGLALDVED